MNIQQTINMFLDSEFCENTELAKEIIKAYGYEWWSCCHQKMARMNIIEPYCMNEYKFKYHSNIAEFMYENKDLISIDNAQKQLPPTTIGSIMFWSQLAKQNIIQTAKDFQLFCIDMQHEELYA